MGLRCSILGHTFDETEVRRDRRERESGNEVVTVVSQVERCSRCGTERVVSENKEVVSVVDADEVGLDDAGVSEDAGPADASEPGGTAAGDRAPDDARGTGSPDADAAAGSDTDTEAEADAGVDADIDAGPGSPADPGPGSPADPGTGSEPPAGPDAGSSTDPAEEDVEFITETEGSLGGGGDVAEDADVPADAGDSEGGIGGMAARSGAFDGSDEGSDPTGEAEEGSARGGDDAEILDAPETERAPGEWPDDPGDDEPWDPDPLDDEGEASPEPTADPAPEVEPAAEPSFTVPEGSLRCPDCGHEVSTDSSFRAGDACPECQGYLEDAGE